LDEPTIGLDPQISESVRLTLKELNQKEGLTIILTTHQMDEAEFLSNRIAFLKEGEIIAEGEAEKLKKGLRFGDLIRFHYIGPPLDLDRVSALEGILKVEVREKQITILVDDRRKRLDSLIRILLSEQHIALQDVEVIEPDLEDVFIELAKTPH